MPKSQAFDMMVAEEIDTQSRLHYHQALNYIPYPRNKNFVQRDNVCDDLKDLLFGRNGADGQRVAIFGLDGIGKTQIALHVAHWVVDHKPNFSVLWLSAASITTFERACANILEKLDIQHGQPEDPKEALKLYLSSEDSRNWLLVVDNLDDSVVLDGSIGQHQGIRNYLPESENIKILFTSRSRELAIHMANRNVIELSQVSEEEARNLLEESILRDDQARLEENGSEFACMLTYLPLAVAHAVAYIDKHKTTITWYRRLCENTEQGMIELFSSKFRGSSHYGHAQDAIESTRSMTTNRLCQADVDASNILSFVAWIEPKAIPKSILPKLGSVERTGDAIERLGRQGFFTPHEDEEFFDMPSLIHLALRVWSHADYAAGSTQKDAVKHLASIFPSDDWDSRHVWRQYMPHALTALRDAMKMKDKVTADLAHWVGRCLLHDGRTADAVHLLQYDVKVKEGILAENHPDRLLSQHQLATAYLANLQVEKAIQLLRPIVAIREEILAEDDHDRLASQHELARAYLDNAQVEESIQLLEHIVAVESASLEENHLDRLLSQHVLATAHLANKNVEKAIQLLQPIVTIAERMLTEDHPNRLSFKHELARAYLCNAQVEEAIQLLEHIVGVEKISLAEDHPDRLKSEHVLTRAYLANGQATEAMTVLKHIIVVGENTQKILAGDYKTQILLQHVRAMECLTNGQVGEAIEALEDVVVP